MGKSKKKHHKPKSEDTNQEKLYLLHMDLYVPIRVASVNGKKYILVIILSIYMGKVLKQNGVVERRNRTLIEATRTMLIYAKALLFLWAEAIATACYTQNLSIIRLRHGKTPYELLHDKLPDLSFLHVFGALCYPTNDSENLGKLQPKVDIVMASEHSSLEPALHEITPTTISSRLVSNPPSRTDWDLLFQPLFDELLNPPPSIDHPTLEVIALIAEVVAPEPAVSIENDFESSSSDVIPTVVYTAAPNSEHVNKWTKDHPLDNIIGLVSNPSSSTPFVPPTRTDWDLLFQPMFDELLNPPPSGDPSASEVIALIAEVVALNLLHQSVHLPQQMLTKMHHYLSKYTLESLKKYGMKSSDLVDTPMVGKSKPDEDPQGKSVDPIHYRGMANPTEKHLHAVKRIFKYLRGIVNRRLWYLKDSSIALTAYADADHMGCQDTRRSTFGIGNAKFYACTLKQLADEAEE
uniref:Retrovirus-related Pol polyprotein from transposon TNT 1-94 n=1 Tax=Tanacetum cinerariifolium TaxID=118510 RepID=A0A6L2N8S4_TANCI|nr:hypothetical protein [Tanacetum cinerariifolium]